MLGLYFSGTGNSKYCVEMFLQELDKHHTLCSIENGCVEDVLKQHEEIVFAYPVQYSTLPKIVYDFIVEHKAIWHTKKIYIIATMGLFSGDGSGVAARLFQACGGHIIGGLHVKMPDCIADEKVLKKSLEKNKQLVFNAHEKIRKAAHVYGCGKPTQTGLRLISRCLGCFGQRLYFGSKTKQYSNKIKINQSSCVGCGMCASLCPMNNLMLVKGRIQSKQRCTLCYRCVNQCKYQAITILGKKIIVQGTIESYL